MQRPSSLLIRQSVTATLSPYIRRRTSLTSEMTAWCTSSENSRRPAGAGAFLIAGLSLAGLRRPKSQPTAPPSESQPSRSEEALSV